MAVRAIPEFYQNGASEQYDSGVVFLSIIDLKIFFCNLIISPYVYSLSEQFCSKRPMSYY